MKKPKHIIDVKMQKNGEGFRATCACGKSMGIVRGCNRAGMDYAIYCVRESFLAHCKKVYAVPYIATLRMFDWMQDVSGDVSGDSSTLVCYEAAEAGGGE